MTALGFESDRELADIDAASCAAFPERANTPIGPAATPIHRDGFGERPIPRRRARGSSVPPAEGPSTSLLLERRGGLAH